MVIERIIERMSTVLSQLEKQYGQLKYITYEDTKMTIIIEILSMVRDVLKNSLQFDMKNLFDVNSFVQFDMGINIKLFVEDSNLETRNNIPLYIKCYNYFLLNTNFSSQYLLKKDMMFGHIVGHWPTLSIYLFFQIIWCLKFEDLMVESFVHIPLDICVEILKEIITFYKYELEISRAIRFTLLLIYKIYYKCLWLHLGILSEQNVTKRIDQLVTYFEILCDLLVSFNNESFTSRGILVKNMLYYIRKCMHSKIESYSENHNLAKLFTLTYGNSDEHTNYYHMVPANEVKSIIMRFDQQLATLLLKQIKNIDSFEFMVWESMSDEENMTISLQNAIVMECHYFIKFMRQNEFLVTNEDLFNRLEQLIRSRKSEKSILTLQELCQDIAKGKLHYMKELVKRYKEWDVCILNFINKRLELLNVTNYYVVLEYLYHIFACSRNKTEKYQVYTAVLKILIRLQDRYISNILLKYIKEHFDDKRLEYLYDKNCFDALIRRISYDSSLHVIPPSDISAQDSRALLIFILLNPKEVLSTFVIYQINIEFSRCISFPYFVQECYKVLIQDGYNVLMYILKDIVLQRRMIWNTQFPSFMNSVIFFEIISPDDLINDIYIPYLNNSYFEKENIHTILSHLLSILKKGICTRRTNFVILATTLTKTASVLRRCNTIFTKKEACNRVKCINEIIQHLRTMWTEEQKDMLFRSIYQSEPLDMQKMRPMMNVLEIIQEYEKRCFVVHQRLRTNPRCHPKLRTYVRSFNLDRDAFLRHMILHCFDTEYATYVFDLIFLFRYHFGWANKMMAYENVMRITAEALHIIAIYAEKFSKDAFVLLLFGLMLVWYSVAKNTTSDKHEEIRHILLRALCSMNHIVSIVSCDNRYNVLFRCIQGVNPSMEINKYFSKICKLISAYLEDVDVQQTSLSVNLECICDERSCWKYCNFYIKKKIPAMYNSYLFIRECIKLSNRETHCYSDRLLRSLYLEE